MTHLTNTAFIHAKNEKTQALMKPSWVEHRAKYERTLITLQAFK